MNDPILEDLNPQQLEAVTAPDGPLLIIAGAGSGKTRVITRRIAYLVQRRGIPPWQIFAATFTNKAAGEMKRRVADLLGMAHPHDFHISTFHSLCARLLRREASAANLSPGFLICDEGDQVSAIKRVMKNLGISDKEVKPGDAQWIINQCKMRMLGPDDIAEIRQSPLEDCYREIFKAYEEFMRENNALDFEDLILRAVRLLQTNAQVLETCQRRYQHVMVDEYQDTNAVQFELVRLLSGGHRNLAVVGDEDQSIYSWRGADIRNLQDFEKYFPDARLIRLEQNYRSTSNILDAAAAVIRHNARRHPKRLFTTGGPGAPITVLAAHSEMGESFAVAGAIQDLVRHMGYGYGDIAVFYRISALSRIFEDRLRNLNIPYRVIGGIRFYDRAEVKDALSYLQVVQNPVNAVALYRIINTPKRGLGTKSIQTVVNCARDMRIRDFEALSHVAREGLVSRAAATQIERFVDQVAEWRKFSETHRPSQLMKRILDDTGYEAALGDPNSLEVQARKDNLQELLNAMTLFENEHTDCTLVDYLENVSLVSAVDELKEGETSVSLMTLHAAKGLEFKIVFIVGVEDNILPSYRAVSADGRLDEERRLFYVGITRSREILILTRSMARTLYGGTHFNLPSPFLAELPANVCTHVSGDRVDLARLVGQKPQAAPTRQDRSSAESKQDAKGERTQPDLSSYLGQRVRHPILGEGVVMSLSGHGKGRCLLIQVDDGTVHQILERYASLEIIGDP